MADYLYNGEKFPDIYTVYTPELQEEYQCAFILFDAGAHRLVFANEVPSCLTFSPYLYVNSENMQYELSADTGDWIFLDENGGFTINKLALKWTSHDILNNDGSVFMATSAPIPVGGEPIDPTSMLMSWQLGARIAGMRGKRPVIPDVPVEPDEPSGEIVGYLYNGVQLPDINEVWTDKSTHQFGTIGNILSDGVGLPTGTTVLFCTESPFLCNDGYYFLEGLGENAQKAPSKVYILNGGEWVYGGEETRYDWARTEISISWANHDIINEDDNSVDLAASDPVPVYA